MFEPTMVHHMILSIEDEWELDLLEIGDIGPDEWWVHTRSVAVCRDPEMYCDVG